MVFSHSFLTLHEAENYLRRYLGMQKIEGAIVKSEGDTNVLYDVYAELQKDKFINH